MITRSDVNKDLRDATARSTSGRGAIRLRAALVISEVALSLALLISAGLLVITSRNIISVDVGFVPQHLVTFGLSLDERQYRDEVDIRLFYDRVLTSLVNLPGIQSARAATLVPLSYLRADLLSFSLRAARRPPLRKRR